MQYQFHESLCNDIGFDGPLHECTIYNNPEAGEKLKSMLALGSSVPVSYTHLTLPTNREV